MLGFPRASRYYSLKIQKLVLHLNVEGIKRVRIQWGLNHVEIMIPLRKNIGRGLKKFIGSYLAEQGLVKG